MIKRDKKGKRRSVKPALPLLVLLMLTTIILLSSNVSGFGVGPSRQYISYTPGETIEGELYLMNDEKNTFKVGIYVEGDLADYVTLDQQLLDVGRNDMIKVVPYKIKFPKKSPRPGDNKVKIVFREFSTDKDVDKGSSVRANLAIAAEIVIQVPYPGKYAEGQLFISNAEDMDKPTKFTVLLDNYGTEDIAQAQAHINIFSPTGDKVGETETNARSLGAKEEVRLDALWDKEVKMGSYIAKAKVTYDNRSLTLEQPFDLGRFTIELSDITVDKFKLGDVAKFNIKLANNWNKKIDSVYSEVIITDENEKEITRFKTAAIDIPAEEVGQLEGYWYTEGVAPGYYTIKFIVHYAGKMTQKIIKMKVDLNEIKFFNEGTGYVISKSEEGKGMSTQSLLIVLILAVVILLIIMNLGWFYFLSKRFKEK